MNNASSLRVWRPAQHDVCHHRQRHSGGGLSIHGSCQVQAVVEVLAAGKPLPEALRGSVQGVRTGGL